MNYYEKIGLLLLLAGWAMWVKWSPDSFDVVLMVIRVIGLVLFLFGNYAKKERT